MVLSRTKARSIIDNVRLVHNRDLVTGMGYARLPHVVERGALGARSPLDI